MLTSSGKGFKPRICDELRMGSDRSKLRTAGRIIKVMSEAHHTDYDDSYPTCIETYSTLRVFSDDLAPEEITKLLQIEPTDSFRKGESHFQGRLRRKANGWFNTTKNLCDSKDTRRHIDMIATSLEGRTAGVEEIHRRGCKIDITSYWLSSGQGGPCLNPQQMLSLGKLGIGVWWDVYFSNGDKT